MEPTKNARIEAAMELLDSQSTLNYAAAAKGLSNSSYDAGATI
jgi:hypothetical protein